MTTNATEPGSSATSVQPSLLQVDWSILPFQGHPDIVKFWGPRDHAGELASLIEQDGGIRDPLLCARITGQGGLPILYDGFTRLSIWFSRRDAGKHEPLPPFVVQDFDSLADVKTKVLRVQGSRRNITAAQLAFAALEVKREQGYSIVARGQGRPSNEKRNGSVKPLPDAKVLAREFGVSDPVIRTAIKALSNPRAGTIKERMQLPLGDPKYLSPIQGEWQMKALDRDWTKHKQAQIAAKRQQKAVAMKVETSNVIGPDGIYVTDVVAGMKKIESESVDLILTSPPYANDMHYDMGNPWDGDYETYLDVFVRRPLQEAKRVLKYGGRAVLNFDNTYRSKEKAKAGDKRDTVPNIYNCLKDFSKIAEDELGFLPMAYHVWYKQNCPNYFAHGSRDFRQPVYNPNTEFVLVWGKDSVRHPFDIGDSDITKEEYDRFSISHWYMAPQPRAKNDHPDFHVCPFPEELAYRVIRMYSPKGGVVLDPFNGSGTTTFVAAALGRQYIGLDLAPTYVQSAKNRIAKLEGLNASQKFRAITRFLPAEGERSDGQVRHRARKDKDGEARS